MPLPERLEPLDVRCPACFEEHGIPGRVQAVVSVDGQELWRVCVCGYSFVGEVPTQGDLFSEVA